MTATAQAEQRPYDSAARAALAAEARRAYSRHQPRDTARPPGPNGWRVLARQLTDPKFPLGFFTDLPRTYPRLSYSKLLNGHLYVMNCAETVDQVHREHARVLRKNRPLQEAKVLLGTSLLTDEGDSHLRHRRMIQPAFHRTRITEYSQRMVAATDEFEQRWYAGKHVDMADEMSALTLDIVGRTLFGADLRGDATDVSNSLHTLLESFPKITLPAGHLIARIPGTSLHNALGEVDRLDAVVQRMIDEHRASGDTGDLLSMLIAAQEDGAGMDDARIRDEAITFVLAGHETTAMNLTWTWYLLARNPKVGRTLRRELADVLGGRLPHQDDLESLPYTRAVIHESLRLFPPAWVIGRQATEDIVVDGWTLPAGSGIMTSQYVMHRDPRYWTSALAFQPERWLTEDGQFSEKAPGQPPGAWFPFGYGKRMCIGDRFALTEAALALSTLAQRWAPTVAPGATIEPKAAITLRPRNGMPMVVQPAPPLV